MTKYRFLLPEHLQDTYSHVEQYLPDSRRSFQVFAQIYLSKDSAFFEIGNAAGLFWLTNIIPGWKAEAHIVLWDDTVRHLAAEARQILNEVMSLYGLEIIFAYIPDKTQYEPALKYCEKIGFRYHCILPRIDQYDGERVDMNVLSFLKEV